MNMLHQYMPVQFGKVRKGTLKAEPEALVRDAVTEVLREYEYGAGI